LIPFAAAGQYGQLTPVKTSNKTHSRATFCADNEPIKNMAAAVSKNFFILCDFRIFQSANLHFFIYLCGVLQK